ncbi:uncharacterized protein LOC112493543 isoform X2 [Ziziphus jujuba]|uniref:Uncharacterized protein LOC112493543 isoform X2 n=1 Tax=Ziziphus jujuba TaxID=326968 RepID=A0A6P6GME7_ZIZJJ|nr:uncharacterized protein LOC112493543 isoform X2 [Ziziphus jujuba]
MDAPFFQNRKRVVQRRMEQFPCALERTVASALLLLSTTPPSLSPSNFDFQDDESINGATKSKSCSLVQFSNFDFQDDESIGGVTKSKSCRGSLVSSDSKNSSSSITSDVFSEETRASKTKIAAAVPHRYEMELKVVRKSRTKIYRNSDSQKLSSDKAASSSYRSAFAETSCISSSSSSASSARSCYLTRRKEKMVREDLMRKRVGSTQMRRLAEAILKLLSGGCFSEMRIRQLLGDSPDTSKALRMLLKLEEVIRSGTGGRQNPYIYMIAG